MNKWFLFGILFSFLLVCVPTLQQKGKVLTGVCPHPPVKDQDEK